MAKNNHVEKEIKGAEMFEVLSEYDKKRFDKKSFIEGFIYGVIHEQSNVQRNFTK